MTDEGIVEAGPAQRASSRPRKARGLDSDRRVRGGTFHDACRTYWSREQLSLPAGAPLKVGKFHAPSVLTPWTQSVVEGNRRVSRFARPILFLPAESNAGQLSARPGQSRASQTRPRSSSMGSGIRRLNQIDDSRAPPGNNEDQRSSTAKRGHARLIQGGSAGGAVKLAYLHLLHQRDSQQELRDRGGALSALHDFFLRFFFFF